MCGLAGFLAAEPEREAVLRDRLERMGAALTHRGPDDGGVWLDAASGAGLAFRRLAIIDLSPLGHQPMASASGRFTLAFNGEIYNFAALRGELEAAGRTFRGRSDTEVILAAFETWGIAASLERFVGMFAIAAWDAERREFTLARDRLGIKPLYVFRAPGVVVFGSELKALTLHPRFDRTVDVNAVAAFLRYLYVPGPASIYANVRKVPPGHFLTIGADASIGEARPYWDLTAVAERGRTAPFRGSDDEAVEALDARLKDSVALRMVADVPLGAFLSGGIDSSTVVALMQAQSARPVQTYSISFSDPDYDEAVHAARVARHVGTDHHQIDVTGDDVLALVPRMAETYDEPLADTAQLPLYLMCAKARQSVTVALSGDGGDEIFAGYNRYFLGERIARRVERMPALVRRGLAGGARRLARPGGNPLLRMASAVSGAALRERAAGERVAKLARLLGEADSAGMYRALVSVWDRPEAMVPGMNGAADAVLEVMRAQPRHARLRRMMLADQLTYLPDDQLAKVDRASMANSLEVRVPLLDHRVVEFAWTLPTSLLVRGGRGKWLLRRVLDRYVPASLIDRPKMGFSVPIDRWLRGPLRDWAEDLLEPASLERDGLLHAPPIRRAWTDLLEGRGAAGLGLWAVVMLQAWRRRWL